jgi:hypothetical protein
VVITITIIITCLEAEEEDIKKVVVVVVQRGDIVKDVVLQEDVDIRH